MKKVQERLSNPKSIEDVLMQCGAYGLGDSKYIAKEIRRWIGERLPKEKGEEYYSTDEDPNFYKQGFSDCLEAVKKALEVMK